MDEITYYESKIQYYVITISGLLLFLFLRLTWDGQHIDDIRHAFSDPQINTTFLSIFAIGLVFAIFYPISKITLNSKGFIYKKGWKILSAEWSDIKGIHANPAPRSYTHNFISTSFLIETTKGITGYIDGSILKIKGSYSPFKSSGNQLLSKLTDYSKINLTVGTYSELVDSKHKKMNWVIIITLLVIIAVSFYFTTKL